MIFENDIVNVIGKYGVIPFSLLTKLFPDESPSQLKRLLQALNARRVVQFDSDFTFIRANKAAKADQDLITALWVFSCAASGVEKDQHERLKAPRQICFIRDGVVYDIVVYREAQNGQNVAKLLQPVPHTHYCIVVDSPDLIEKYDAVFKANGFDMEKINYVTVSYPGSIVKEPEISFFESSETD